MSSSNYRFTLNMQDEHSQVSLPVRLNDTDRKLYITIADGGKPLFIEKGCIAWFFGKKSDETEIATSCIIEGNSVIRYDFNEQTASYPGIINCEIRLYDKEGNLVTSPRFIMVVDERVIFDNDIVSSDYVTVLDELLGTEATRQSNEVARVGAEEARADAETERATAEFTRNSNEIERASAENTRISNENARIGNENARASAETTRKNNDKIRESNEDIRIGNENSRASAESGRVSAETTRNSNENGRKYDESQRVSAESARVTAEKSRVYAEQSRANNEDSRINAEQWRVKDENSRNTYEQARRDAEKIRVSNETSRVSAETERLASEATRISNEDIRIANETERIANDKVREDTFANAIKVTEIGETIRVDDVSPCMHNVKCKVKSDNSSIDLTTVTVTRCGKNLCDFGSVEIDNANYGLSLKNRLPAWKTYTISADVTSDDTDATTCLILYSYAGGYTPVGKIGRGVRQSIVFTPEADVTGFSFYSSDTAADSNGDSSKFENIQVELGEVATEYEPYNGTTTHNPLSDGTVDGIKSVSPTMTLFTDTAGVEIEIEYNRDTNQLADKKLSSTSTHAVQNKIITDNFARVDNEFDALKRRVDSIDEVSKGAVEAKSFMTYADMLAEINAESKDRYKVGQHFIIQTIGVPDLYIYGVSDTSATYVYTTDEAVVNATTEGYVQVGYYRISQLETQKVDLTDYAKKDQVPVIRASQKENGAYTLTITMGVE